ncbi:MAG: prolipoprotein diacylglyceryl transferase [Patescibacteria group bacterium]|jgi:phosphatidylglycerol:prolipoprotein diacylglycerol transferase
MLAAPPSAEILTLGSVSIRWYGLILAVALLSGVLLAQRLGKRVGIAPEKLVDLAIIAAVLGVVGARLAHVAQTWGYYQTHLLEILQLWKGGLAFHGVLAGGLLALWLYSRRQRIPWRTLLDISFPALALGQVIGRWGNWVNQELYGRPTSVPWALNIDPAHRLPGYEAFSTFHPLFLYESLANGIILIILLLMWRKKGLQPGTVAAVYLILSPSVRFGLDFLRLQQTQIGTFTVAQILSPVLVAAGVALLLSNRSHSKDQLYVQK